MSIDALITLVPPPEKPRRDRNPRAWERSLASLAISLPLDWRDIAESYGSGTFRDRRMPFWFLWIYNPLSPQFVKRIRQVCDRERESEPFYDQPFELHPFFPDIGGYFPIGEDDSQNTFWLQMLGPPEEWPVVVWGGFGSERVLSISLPLGNFLAEFLSGRIPVWGYEEGFPEGVSFKSDRST